MTCYSDGALTICRPNAQVRRRVMFCHWCLERRRFLIHAYEWYAPDAWCGSCGTHYNEDGYRVRTPEAERDRNRQRVRAAWKESPRG